MEAYTDKGNMDRWGSDERKKAEKHRIMCTRGVNTMYGKVK